MTGKLTDAAGNVSIVLILLASSYCVKEGIRQCFVVGVKSICHFTAIPPQLISTVSRCIFCYSSTILGQNLELGFLSFPFVLCL